MSREQRRLAAVMSADVVGYSRLMGADETGTLHRLKAARNEVVDPTIEEYGGRIVKSTGDGVLCEFPSAVDAVQCAVSIQNAIFERAKSEPENTRLQFRIGINLGDIIIDEGDIFGDGVNVAARLEGLAAPGGICISSIVHESLGNRIDVPFVDAGEHVVKNISKPMRVYRWLSEANERGPAEIEEQLPGRPSIPSGHKPTIALPPFENLSSDAELGFLCEGIAEDISVAIGNVAQLTVVAADAAQNIGGSSASPTPQRSARYILEGSVRKAASRLRVSAHLLDTFSGTQVWAQRFDRDGDDIFEVQDDVARNIVIAIHTELGAGSYTNRWQHGTNNFEAWQWSGKAFHEFQKFSPYALAKSAAMWDQAYAIDADYIAALAASAFCYAYMALWKDKQMATAYLDKAQSAFEAAVNAAPADGRPYSAKRAIEIANGNYDGAIAAAQTACDLEPNEPACWANLAFALMCADKPKEALAQITKATKEIQNYPGWYAMVKIQSQYMLGEYVEAVREAEDIVERAPDFYAGPVLLAVLYAELDRMGDARKMGERVRQMDPEFSIDVFVKSQGLKNAEHRERLARTLAGIGLPA